MVKRFLPLMLAGALVACSNDFQKVSIVLDLRVLALRADPAEVVIDADDSESDLTASQLPAVTFSSLVLDPLTPGPFTYTWTACPTQTTSVRCDDATAINRVFTTATTADLEHDPPTGTLTVDDDLLAASLDADPYHGFAGVPVNIQLVVQPADASAPAVYAVKVMTYSAKVPSDRVANNNPYFDELDADGVAFAGGACDDPTTTPLPVDLGQTVTLLPIEPDGVRETYVVETFDGGERTFTENLSYAWFSTTGDFSDETSGGAQDAFGNQPLLRTKWQAPSSGDPDSAPGTLIPLWIVQRDERGGTYWTSRCFVVKG